MMSSLGRPAVAVLLPSTEREPVAEQLRAGGFDPIHVGDARELSALLAARRDVIVAILDVEGDPDTGLDAWSLLHDAGRSIPALLVVNASTLDHLDSAAPGHEDDEYLTRPYSAESIRWRLEAMCIRSLAVDDGSGPVLQTSNESVDWSRRGKLLAAFSPKGGVGKTTLVMNLAAALVAKGKRVLVVDADTVTGHVATSLGMHAIPSVADAWRDELEGGPVRTFDELATVHTPGLKILALSSSPMNTEILDPQRVADAVTVAQRSADYVIVDLHPSYGPLNRALFDRADRILVPVTPDVPAIRAVVQLREIADELGVSERLALIINRANSGVSVADMERTVGMPAYAQISSAGMLLIKAANEGRTVVEMAPREKISGDFNVLADRILGISEPEVAKPQRRLFGRTVAARTRDTRIAPA
jgi:MinD-like ATPase involved in chromosome partitioning or flagellar assembly